jgi:hypothetical protein
VPVFAIVDSGAARTYLPLAVADVLGIRASLEMDAEESIGVGSTFATWSHRDPILGQIVARFPHGRERVGPEFELRPSFGEPAQLLLGRADFFQAFRITFHENPVAPVFHLDW